MNIPTVAELLGEDTPSNWGKWGDDDELGALNYLGPEEVLNAISAIRAGQVFTLQVPIGHAHGDPTYPGRDSARRENLYDESNWAPDSGKETLDFPGGMHFADDRIEMSLQGSTQYDALGHVWYDGKIWNGFDASETIGGMKKASVFPIANKGVVGRGVLIDIARHRKKDYLAKGETFTHEDLLAAASNQGVSIQKRDILLVRTGFMKYFYDSSPEEFYAEFIEPGLTYSRELVEWFQEMEIPNLVTDTIGNEVTVDPVSSVALPLHCSLMRNLGVSMTEIVWLEDLAEACAAAGQWAFLYAAAPLKVVEGTGAPVNPIAIL